MNLLLVMAGGALGAGARHLVGLASLRLLGPAFPWATLFVNIVGSGLMGVLIGWLTRAEPANAASLRLFLATGVLGGFTTFSTFSLDALTLWEAGRVAAAVTYVAASLALSLAGIAAGLWLMRILQ